MIRIWLRGWLGITAIETREQLKSGNDGLAFERSNMALSHISELEKELAKIEAAHAAEVNELRERLEMPAKRKPSGRPFSVLQKVAAMGAEAQRMKDAG